MSIAGWWLLYHWLTNDDRLATGQAADAVAGMTMAASSATEAARRIVRMTR
jgi:hypothetical protein